MHKKTIDQAFPCRDIKVWTQVKKYVNEMSTAGADASVEALKLYHMLSLLSLLAGA